MDNLSKALLAGIASGVWFIAVLGGYAWSMYRVKTDPLSYYGDETLVFLGIPFVMMTSSFFKCLSSLPGLVSASGRKKLMRVQKEAKMQTARLLRQRTVGRD